MNGTAHYYESSSPERYRNGKFLTPSPAVIRRHRELHDNSLARQIWLCLVRVVSRARISRQLTRKREATVQSSLSGCDCLSQISRLTHRGYRSQVNQSGRSREAAVRCARACLHAAEFLDFPAYCVGQNSQVLALPSDSLLWLAQQRQSLTISCKPQATRDSIVAIRFSSRAGTRTVGAGPDLKLRCQLSWMTSNAGIGTLQFGAWADHP